jgi:hypothetical protein
MYRRTAVPPNGPEGVGIVHDAVVEPGLPFEFRDPVSADLFGAHRFVPPDDGPQRMGAQPKFVGGFGIHRLRRFVSPRRIYGGMMGRIVARIGRGNRRNADQVIMPIKSWMWSGVTIHASNRTYGRTTGVRCHSRAAMHPAADNPMMPFRTCPKNGRRFPVQIVTKYHPDRRYPQSSRRMVADRSPW